MALRGGDMGLPRGGDSARRGGLKRRGGERRRGGDKARRGGERAWRGGDSARRGGDLRHAGGRAGHNEAQQRQSLALRKHFTHTSSSRRCRCGHDHKRQPAFSPARPLSTHLIRSCGRISSSGETALACLPPLLPPPLPRTVIGMLFGSSSGRCNGFLNVTRTDGIIISLQRQERTARGGISRTCRKTRERYEAQQGKGKEGVPGGCWAQPASRRFTECTRHTDALAGCCAAQYMSEQVLLVHSAAGEAQLPPGVGGRLLTVEASGRGAVRVAATSCRQTAAVGGRGGRQSHLQGAHWCCRS